MSKKLYDLLVANFILCGLLLLLSSGAWAGQSSYPEVYIDLTTSTASGSFVGARDSADIQQYLYCAVKVTSPNGNAYMECDSRDAQGNTLQCISAKPAYVDAVLGLTDYSHVMFTVIEDAQGVRRCDSLEVETFARYLP